MTRSSIKVSTHYRISIPQQARRQLKIRGGDQLLVDVQDGMIILLPEPESYTRLLAGLHHEIWGKSDEYIISERNGWIDVPR